ncbi:MAG: peptidoglycan DD-metalloendopeptidase family protein [Actinomycetota bacterium]|nr:peptidoglycan DD-metalloendopeptidase family protein [Actinomycetota bacterium]
MTWTRTPAAALAALLVLALAAPSFADPSAEDKRDTARTKKAQLAAQINTLKANDDQLEDAVRALDAGIQVAANDTAAAQQALRAAQTGLTTAEARLAETERRMGELRVRASAAAVRAYVHPGGDSFLEIVRARDLGEASRRQTLLSTVVSNDRDVVDQMRAARQDQQFEQDNLAKARDLAADRRKAAAEKLGALEKTRSDQVRLKSALDGRIAAFTAEVDALSREEATLTALLRQRQATAPPPPAAASGRRADAKVSGAGFVWPAGGPVTSGFGFRWGRMHTGIDIGAPAGAPVSAAKGGTVIMAGYNGGYGNSVIVDHGGGLSTLYAHLSRIGTSDGAVVKQGQNIGSVGSTGNSTGAHLHFETRVGGSAENPIRYLP